MLTLYYAPQSRATRAYQLVDELGAFDSVKIAPVAITRMDGSTDKAAANPHPEGKVPLLDHDGTLIWESAAIFAHLTALFPEAGLAPAPGTPAHGRFLSWLAWYAGVMEPVIHFQMLKIDNPALKRTFRGPEEMNARLINALSDAPYLLGEAYSAADLMIASTFAWLRDATPDDDNVRAWVQRCLDRPAAKRAVEFDASLMANA